MLTQRYEIPTFFDFLRISIVRDCKGCEKPLDRNEKKLIKACKKGDKQAFDELIRRYYPYVKGFLTKTTSDEVLSDDLTQDTFLKIIQKIELFDLKQNISFGTYLITVAKNTYIDYCRRNCHISICIDDIILPDGSSVDDNIISKLESERLERMLDSIPPEQAQAIRLKYYEKLSLNEIAEISGVKPQTVKSRIHDGKVKLRKILKKEDGGK